jgi:tetrahydromethanopterin S-methyltransferase subunit C
MKNWVQTKNIGNNDDNLVRAKLQKKECSKVRMLISVTLAILGLMVIYQKRFRIISYLISIGFLRRFITIAAMNLPGLKEKFFNMTFSRSAENS